MFQRFGAVMCFSLFLAMAIGSNMVFGENRSEPPVATNSKPGEAEKKPVPESLRFDLESLTGEEVPLSNYHGKVIVVVNVASKCGFTSQYEGLEALYKKYGKDGLVVFGVPCNQFGGQEPGSAEEIALFCKENYGVSFPLFAKIDVNGDEAHPFYKYLTAQENGQKFAGPIKWNFEKFVIGRDGKVVVRFRSKVKPDDPELVKVVEAQLKKKNPTDAPAVKPEKIAEPPKEGPAKPPTAQVKP